MECLGIVFYLCSYLNVLDTYMLNRTAVWRWLLGLCQIFGIANRVLLFFPIIHFIRLTYHIIQHRCSEFLSACHTWQPNINRMLSSLYMWQLMLWFTCEVPTNIKIIWQMKTSPFFLLLHHAIIKLQNWDLTKMKKHVKNKITYHRWI
jgi:hypothetical protein